MAGTTPNGLHAPTRADDVEPALPAEHPDASPDDPTDVAILAAQIEALLGALIEHDGIVADPAFPDEGFTTKSGHTLSTAAGKAWITASTGARQLVSWDADSWTVPIPIAPPGATWYVVAQLGAGTITGEVSLELVETVVPGDHVLARAYRSQTPDTTLLTVQRTFFGVQPGTLRVFAGAIPTGWLEADGTDASRTTYQRLFRTVGTEFGAGDGSTTFGLPDAPTTLGAGQFWAVKT